MFTLDSWSADDYDNLTEYLKSNADLKYRDFLRLFPIPKATALLEFVCR